MDLNTPLGQEAARLRLLSRYNEVDRLWQDAHSRTPDDYSILFQWALAKREQHLFGNSLQLLDRCMQAAQQQHASPRDLALVELSTLLGKCFVHGCVADGAARAVEIFNNNVRRVPASDFDTCAVSTLTQAITFRMLLVTCGEETHFPAPCLGRAFYHQLQARLLGGQRYLEAARIANVCQWDGDVEGGQLKADLLQAVIDHPDVPHTIRAFALEMLAKYIRQHVRDRDWTVEMHEARRLYTLAGSHTWADEAYIALLTMAEPRAETATTDVSLQDTAEKMFQIQRTAEESGYPSGAISALQAINELQHAGLIKVPESIQHRVNSELQRLYDQCQNNLSQAMWLCSDTSRWIMSGGNEGRLRAVLERQVDTLSRMKLGLLLASTVQYLYASYLATGEHDKAAACLDRLPQTLVRRFHVMLRSDPFSKKLRAMTKVDDADALQQELRSEIREAESAVQSTEQLEFRMTEVQRLTDFPILFCNLRLLDPEFEQYGTLAMAAIEAADGLVKYLAPSDARQAQHETLQKRAFVSFQTAGWTTDPNERKALMLEALQKYMHCLDDGWGKPAPHSAAMITHMVGGCYKALWTYQGCLTPSDDLTKADEYFAKGKDMLKAGGFVEGQLMLLWTLTDLWHLATLARGGQGSREFLEKILGYAAEAEEVVTMRRVDLSALQSTQALVAKQGLRQDHKIQRIYDLALDALCQLDNVGGLWDWLQRFKSRAMSDMLALGINVPTNLSQEIALHPDVQEILVHEKELVERIEADDGAQLALRRQLDSLRDEMRTHPTLRKVLDLREGRPTSLAALQDLASNVPGEPRPTYFVDWFISHDRVGCLVASSTGSDEIKAAVLDATLADVTAWKAKYFAAQEQDDEHALHLFGDEASRELGKLVALIVQTTGEGDLLVLCPTGPLHGIPLHAAYVDDESEQTLIERNPVVYTSSMTTLEYSMSRQLARGAKARTGAEEADNAFVAVFESLEDGGLGEAEARLRDDIYTAVASMAASVPRSTIVTGAQATTTAVSRAFGADLVYFFGHCSFEPADYLKQGLLLAAETHYTAAMMFDTAIDASNVMLMACGSAMESHRHGDEPLGITTALVCAGASSVTGTLWKVRTSTALAFSGAFHVALARERARGGGVVDLARAVQTAVCRLKKRPQTRSPLYWAAFVLHGSWFMGHP